MSVVDAILAAIRSSDQADRQISLSACGHASAVSNLKKNRDARISSAEALCRELGLELYAGPPRRESDVIAVARALGLPADATLEDLLQAIRILQGPDDTRRSLARGLNLIHQGADQVMLALERLKRTA